MASNYRALKQQVQNEAESLREELVALSHDLAAHPELKFAEHRSVKVLTEQLQRHGFAVEHPVGGLDTAFRATRGNGAHRLAFVAEYDALDGLGHACGHNIIATSALGAGIALANALPKSADVTVEVIGAPAEEGGGGKVYMLDDGVFEGLDLAMMIHPGPVDSLWARPFAVAHLDVEYTGKASHAAAYPYLGINASDAMIVAQTAIALLRQQLPASVRVHGIVNEAGTAPNAIPDYAKGSWYVRAANLEQLEEVFQQVAKCFEAGGIASGCKMKITETSPRYSEFRNDEELAGFFNANAQSIGRDMDPNERRPGGMNTASTDMGNVSRAVRAIHPYLGIDSGDAVNHQKEFAAAAVTQPADNTIIDGAYLMAATVLDYLETL